MAFRLERMRIKGQMVQGEEIIASEGLRDEGAVLIATTHAVYVVRDRVPTARLPYEFIAEAGWDASGNRFVLRGAGGQVAWLQYKRLPFAKARRTGEAIEEQVRRAQA